MLAHSPLLAHTRPPRGACCYTGAQVAICAEAEGARNLSEFLSVSTPKCLKTFTCGSCQAPEATPATRQRRAARFIRAAAGCGQHAQARSANGSTVHRRLRPLAPLRRDMRAGVRAPSLICLAASQARAADTGRCGTRAQEGTWQLGGLSSSTISRPSLPRRTLIFARASAHTAHPEVNHCACPCGAVFALFFRSFFKEPLFRKRGNTRVFIEDFVFQPS